MTSFFLCLIFAALCFGSAHSRTTTFLVLPGEQNIPLSFQTLEPTYVDCDSTSDDAFFLRETNKNLGPAPPLGCHAKTALPSTPFYMIKMDSKPIEYSCFSNMSNWDCKHERPNSRDILQCNIISNLNSIATIHSGETLIDCYLSSSFQISHYSSYLKVSLHSLYPLVQKYYILKNQKLALMPNLGFSKMNPTCRINNHKVSVKTKEFSFYLDLERQDILAVNALRNSQNATTTTISLELQSKLAKGIILNLDLKLEIMPTEIEAFYQETTTQVYVMSRQVSSQFSYILISENKSLTVSCLPQTNAFQVPTILRCSGFPENLIVSSQRWRLGALDGIKVVSHSKLFEVQKLPNLKNHTFLNVTSKVLDPYPALILTVNSSSWLTEFKGPTIIECNFFNDQSTLGLLLDTNKIACPVLKDHLKYLAYLDNDFDVTINLDLNEYLFINISQSPGTVLPSPSFRMLDMQVLYAFSILDPLIIVEPAQETYDQSIIRTFNVLDAIFDLDAFSSALITIDLRFLSEYNDSFVYGDDWEIAITVGNNLGFGDLIPVTLPEIFLSSNYSKAQVHEFILSANVDLEFKVDVAIHNDSFLNSRYSFVESASVEIVTPYRAKYDEPLAFYAMIVPSSGVTLPTNLPIFDTNKNQPNYQLSLGSIRSGFDDQSLEQHEVTSGVNLFDPETLYWGTSTYATMTYLPYFSNCKAFDKYIPIFSLFEQSSKCDLVAPEDTVYIKPFGFGSMPTADTCSSVRLSCILDEDITISSTTPRWFEQGAGTLFYMTKKPQSASTMNSDSINTDTNNFIPVTVSGDYEDGKLPSLVQVEFDYYQLSTTEKRLVTGTVTLSNFISLTTAQKNGTDTFPYTLEVSLIPLGHTDLLIAFEFEYYVYLVLYFGIGLIAVLKTTCVMSYFVIFSRNNKKLAVKYWCYVKLLVPPMLKGMLLAFIPVVVMVIIISALMVGEIWNWPINSCETSDASCYRSVFDVFALKKEGITDRSSSDFTNLRNGRAGCALIVAGAMTLILISQDYVKKSKKNAKPEEAFDGNIWTSNMWARIAMLAYCVLHVVFYLFLVQFSFSDSFGNNVYIFIGLMKIVGMITGEIGETMLEDRLLMVPILMMHELMEGLITFGASDFLAFLVSNYIELGIQTVERPFIASVVETIVPFVEDKYTRTTKFIKKAIFDAEDTEDSEDEEEEKEKLKKEKKEKEKNENSKIKDKPADDKTKENENDQNKSRKLSLTDDSSDSNIILSDQEESLDTSMSASLIVDMNIESDLSESGDEFEREVKKRLHNKEKEKQKQAIGDLATTHSHVLHDEIKNASFDKLCDLSIESVAIIYTPFSTLMMWVFYSVNNLIPGYGIAEPDIIFYLLYGIVIIPFQLSNDILHFNIAEFYHGEKIYEYLRNLVERYKNRKMTWKGSDDDVDIDMDEISRRVDQFCFSSQYFFLMTIGTSGVYFMLLGGQTLVSSGYNPFNDVASYYTIIIFIVLTVALYYATFHAGKLLRIWKIQITDKSGDSSTMNPKSEESSISEEGEGKVNINLVLRNITNWDNVDKAHAFKERLHEATKGLHSANFNDDQFKTDMIKANYYWFTSNVKEVFTPTTLKGKRRHIIQSFKQIYGELSPRVIGEDHINDEVETKFVDQREKKIIKKSLPHSFIAILKLWKTRAALIRKIRSQVAGIVESSTGSRCEFCRTNQNLRAELVPNIEDIFIKFLKDHPTQNTVIWSVEKWQEVFKKNALIRTLCFECFTEILDHHIETSVQETINRRVNERRRRTKGLATNTSMSMSMDHRRTSKKMSFYEPSKEESGGQSRLETKDFQRLETEESRILEGQKDIEPLSATTAQRDMKTEARIRLIENENVKSFLKGWLDMAKLRVKPPDTFR